MKSERSEAWFTRAQAVIPGGVNSPVRAFRGVGGIPRFIERGQGSRIFDTDGNSYIDYVGSWGPLILGHCPPAVTDAVIAAARTGTSFGASTPAEIDLADNMGNASGGVHAAALGGLWQAVVFGFGGLHFTPAGPALDPRLPPGWHGLRFPVQWRGDLTRMSADTEGWKVTP